MAKHENVGVMPLFAADNSPVKIDDLRHRRTDELVIALVGPVGSGCSKSAEIIMKTLSSVYKYDEVAYYKVSDTISDSAPLVGMVAPGGATGSDRAKLLQDIGNKLRQRFMDDYLAAKVIERIAEHRHKKGGFQASAEGNLIPEPKRWAHVVDSLKNPAELSLLREVYGDMLWVVGVFAPEDIRKDRLKNLERWEEKKLADLIARDNKEAWHFGQGVRDTFFQADFFIRNDGENDQALTATIKRHLEVIFGVPVHTPSRDESAMYAAHAAASQSACLSRQVGAALVSDAGDLLGVGWNDVPKYKGGLYTFEDGPDDHRCFKWGGKLCHNDEHKTLLYKAIFDELNADELLKDGISLRDATEAVRRTDIKQLIEYSRAVHAEMAALIDVARGAKSGLVGATLYCTTYPCHSCARHLVAAGVKRVFYIEPYPKSLATELHRDATTDNVKEADKKMLLQQYEGVAPQNLLRLFKPHAPNRKDAGGRLVDFSHEKAQPLGSISVDDFSTHEKRVLSRLKTLETPR